MEAKEKTTWHLDKKVGVSHILATASIAIMFFSFIQKQDVRIELLEQRLQIEVERSEKLDSALEHRIEMVRQEGKSERREIMTDIRQRFNSVDAKLDKVIDRDN